MISTKYLGLEINHLKWKNPIDQMATKLSGAFYAVKLMSHIALLTPKSIYFTNFNGLSNSEKIFALHKIIGVLVNAIPGTSFSSLFMN
jgi:hypothetical protein